MDNKPYEEGISTFAAKICERVPQAEMIFLYGSYAQRHWGNGSHVHGRSRLTDRKRSDYDTFVVTRFDCTATDTAPWDAE